MCVVERGYLPGSSPIKLPTMKSNADMSRIISKMNCSLMTHLTPATFMEPSSKTAAVAKPRMAHLLPSSPTKPAIDSPKPMTLRAQPTAWPKQYSKPRAPPKRDPSVWAMRKYTPPLSTRHRSQIPTAESTLTRAIKTVHKMMSTALIMPAWATIQPERKNTITPNTLIRQEVNTPSQVPNSTGWEMKKFERHLLSDKHKDYAIKLGTRKSMNVIHLPRFVPLFAGKNLIGARRMMASGCVRVLIAQIHESASVIIAALAKASHGYFAIIVATKTKTLPINGASTAVTFHVITHTFCICYQPFVRHPAPTALTISSCCSCFCRCR